MLDALQKITDAVGAAGKATQETEDATTVNLDRIKGMAYSTESLLGEPCTVANPATEAW